MELSVKKTALVLVDLQNDFVHSDGAYGRAGQRSDAISALPKRINPLAELMRLKGGWIISTHFTLVSGKDGDPFISADLKKLRPFLGHRDFQPGSWGHALIDELKPADLSIEKVAYSAFYQTRLEWLLNRAEISTLIFSGIVTNGGVASTVRDAHVRDFETVVLSDGCAAFTEEAHAASIASLKSITEVRTCVEMISALGG